MTNSTKRIRPGNRSGLRFADLRIDDREDDGDQLPAGDEEILRLEDAEFDHASESLPAQSFQVLGYATNPSGEQLGIAAVSGASNATILFSLEELSGSKLHAALVKQKVEHCFRGMKEREIAENLKALASGKRVVIINKPGLHFIEKDGASTPIYAWENVAYVFGQQPPIPVRIAEDAAKTAAKAGTSAAWKAEVLPIAKGNPRLLVALATSLSAPVRRVFGGEGWMLALTGSTSKGKSSIQRVCNSLTGKAKVKPWRGTELGNLKRFETKPDQPCCVDDVHKAKFKDLAQVIMVVGNDGEYEVANSAGERHKHPPVHTTAIVSSEKSLLEMGRSLVEEGMSARYFEVRLGKYGAFDSSCGYEGDAEAIGKAIAGHLKRATSLNFGTLWPEWLALLEKNWNRVVQLHTEKLLSGKFEESLLRECKKKLPAGDTVGGRIVEKLVFAAFMGAVATELGYWNLSKTDVKRAFARLIDEYIENRPAPAAGAEQMIVDALRDHIRDIRGNIETLSSYGQVRGRSGVVAYFCVDEKEGDCIAFEPRPFRQKFESEFGSRVYRVLHEQGFLVKKDPERNTVQMTVPKSKPRIKPRMFLIRARIMVDEQA